MSANIKGRDREIKELNELYDSGKTLQTDGSVLLVLAAFCEGLEEAGIGLLAG